MTWTSKSRRISLIEKLLPRMPQFRRTARLNEQLRQEISLLIRSEVRDPRVGTATITSVDTSPELDHARIYVTCLGEASEKEEVLAGLRSAAPFIRGQLGKRLHMRRVPELHFDLDRKLENALRIETLLREALPADTPGKEAGEGEPGDREDAASRADDRGE